MRKKMISLMMTVAMGTVSGFWHIHAKTPRGTVVCEQ